MTNPVLDFTLTPSTVTRIGRDLVRPECVLADAVGRLWVSDGRGGVTCIEADGRQALLACSGLPNGLAFAHDGSLLVANFAGRCLERLNRDGRSDVLLHRLDGRPLGQVNFVLNDRHDRIWLTVSTERDAFFDAFRPDVADGSIILIDAAGPRRVATGLAFPNELRLDPTGRWLYVAETTGRRIRRLAVGANGDLGPAETFGPLVLGPGFPDGICFDSLGNLWVAMVGADRLIVLTPDGRRHDVMADGQLEAIARMEERFIAGTLTPADLAAAAGRIAPLTTSIAFGGPGRRTAYLGSLRGTSLAAFEAPVAGLAPC